MTAHKDLTGADLHEPRGIEDATSGQVYTADGAGSGSWVTPGTAIASGTKMLFQQTAAPSGWTKDTTHNDKVLRVVSGTASSGGSVAFSTVFGRTATDSYVLTQANLPSGITITVTSTVSVVKDITFNTTTRSSSGATSILQSVDTKSTSTVNSTGSLGGSGTGHTHPIDLRVQYVDLIIATKD